MFREFVIRTLSPMSESAACRLSQTDEVIGRRGNELATMESRFHLFYARGDTTPAFEELQCTMMCVKNRFLCSLL